jgi:hypothetical protein
VVLGVPIEVFNNEAFRREFKEALILIVGRNLSASNIHFLCAQKVATLSEESVRRPALRYKQFQEGRSGRELEELSALRVLYSISLFSTSEAGGTEATESAQRIRQSLSTGNLTTIFLALVNQDGVADSVALASANFTPDATLQLYTGVSGDDTTEGSSEGEGEGEAGSGEINTAVIVSTAAICLLLLLLVSIRYRRKRGKMKKSGAVFVAPEIDAMTAGTASPQIRGRLTGSFDSFTTPARSRFGSGISSEERLQVPSDANAAAAIASTAELAPQGPSKKMSSESLNELRTSPRRRKLSDDSLDPGRNQRAGSRLVPIREMESMQFEESLTNRLMPDGDSALRGVFNAEEEKLSDMSSKMGKARDFPVDLLCYQTQRLDSSGDVGTDGHTGSGAGINVPAKTETHRNLRQGEYVGGGREAWGSNKGLTVPTRDLLPSRSRSLSHEISARQSRSYSHEIDFETGPPSLKADVPVTLDANSQYDFAKAISRDAMSAKDLSGQQPVPAQPWRVANTSSKNGSGSIKGPRSRHLSFDRSSSLDEPLEPKFRRKDKSRDAFGSADTMFGCNPFRHGSNESNNFCSSRNRSESNVLSNDLNTVSSENYYMMDMDLAGPNTESHAENSLTCGSPGRSEGSDTWRIDVEEVLDCDVDGTTSEALP